MKGRVFPLRSGTQQRRRLSALLLSRELEVLARETGQEQEIKGTPVGKGGKGLCRRHDLTTQETQTGPRLELISDFSKAAGHKRTSKLGHISMY